jgi:cell division protein FtsI/penicillin-binding protein 2
VLAVANQDPGGAAWDRALSGQYAPGSVFKIASGLALLDAGVSPDDDIDCPKTANVGGKSFKNAEDEVLGTVSFAEDFAHSCNTAFVSSGDKVSGSEVADAAAQLGMLGDASAIGAKMASVPADDDEVTHAAQMIGQGKVQSSPLAVATMAASVEAGETVTPQLVVGEALDEAKSGDGGQAAGEGTGHGDAPALDADAAKEISVMMRAVVTEGTATDLKDVPGDPVHGKTGTAEYGNDSPPRTHSWFAGFQGDLAVAVLVEDGGFGAEAAVPVAHEFFDNVN